MSTSPRLKKGELPIVELAGEQLRDPPGVDRRRLSEAGDASLGERHHDTAAVVTRSVSANEAFISEASDATAHPRPRDEGSIRQLSHAQSTLGRGQLSEHARGPH